MTARMALMEIGVAMVAASAFAACTGDAADAETGSLGMEVQIGPGVTLSSVNWSINNAASGFSRTGSVNVRFSNTISFQTGVLPPGAGYAITLGATSVDGAFTCIGSAGFKVTAGVVTPVTTVLTCSSAAPGQGTIVVNGTTQLCANLDSLSASPLETAVNTSILLSATGSLGALTPTFAWTASAGTFDDATLASPTYTCPATPGKELITVSISPSSTFTNVYANIIGARCIGCHRPGGGGVNVGMLDMSTPSAAYANLVGVTAKGIGAGTSGVTCASLTPPAVRVVAGDSASSLIFDKVHSKLVGGQPPCGSPMPLPAAAAPLTAAEVALIAAWVDAGALNN